MPDEVYAAAKAPRTYSARTRASVAATTRSTYCERGGVSGQRVEENVGRVLDVTAKVQNGLVGVAGENCRENLGMFAGMSRLA